MATGVLSTQVMPQLPPYATMMGGSPAPAALPSLNPTASPTSPTGSNLPSLDQLFFGSNLNFNDIMSRFSTPPTINTPTLPGQSTIAPMTSASGGNDALFNRAIQASTPSAGIDPVLQGVLDNIRRQQAQDTASGVAAATSLAAKRGLAGSSIEQFGTQTAAEQASKAAQDASSNVYLSDAQRRFQLQDSMSKLLGDRSNLEYTTGANAATNQAQLNQQLNLAGFDAANQDAIQQAGLNLQQNTSAATSMSDELASRRNLAAYMQQLQLQQSLGQQGLDIQRDSIGVQRDIANDQQRAGLINSGIGAILPGLLYGGGGGGLFGGGGGGGGILGGLFGGGGGASILGGVANPGAGAAASSLFPGGLGAVGTGATASPSFLAGGLGSFAGGAGLGLLGGMAGRSVFGGGNDVGGLIGGGAGMALGGPVGAGIGAFVGTGLQRAGEYGYGLAQKTVGNSVASVVRPFVDPVGSVKKIGSTVGKAIGNVFPF